MRLHYLLALVAVPLASTVLAQNTWDGSTTSTITTSGNVGIGSAVSTNRLNISNTLTANGIVHNTTNSLTTAQFGFQNTLTANGASGNKFGLQNVLSSVSSNVSYGFHNTLTSTGTGAAYGMHNTISAGNASASYGIYTTNTSVGSANKTGIYSSLSNSATGGLCYGIYSTVSAASATGRYGIYTTATVTGANNSSTDATTFGLYSVGTGANSRAGYFKGDVEINAGNTIYAAPNGSKTLILQNYGAGDYAYSIALNQTDNQYDWGFKRGFVLNRAGQMIKGFEGDDKAFMIKRYDLDANGLDVFRVYGNGKVYATEINVQILPFPDYVFQPDYELMPLKEVGKYIEENGHLPNVPTAEVVQAEGANLGEMTKTLVEKVEELTLYLLKQQEELDAQKSAMEAQQREIEALKSELEATGTDRK